MTEPSPIRSHIQASVPSGMPISAFIRRLIWVCMVPLVLLAVWLAVHSVLTKHAERDREAANLVKNVATAVDQRLRARMGGLNLLAVSPLVDDQSRWKELYQEALGFLGSFGTHVVFSDVAEPMRMLFNTRVPFGEKLPLLPRPKGRAAASTAVETGKPAVGDVFWGPVAKEPLVAIAVPVVRDAKVAFLMLTILDVRHFQERMEQVALDPGWSLALLDGTGEIIARRGPSGPGRVKDRAEAKRFIAGCSVSPWSVVLEIPRALYWAPLKGAVLALGAGVLGAMLVGVLGGILAGRRLGREVASLGEAPVPDTPAPTIVEIAEARHLLDAAAEQREADAAALRGSEEKYRLLAENISDVIWVLDLQTSHFRYVSPSVEQLRGYTVEEVMSQDMMSTLTPSSAQNLAQGLPARLAEAEQSAATSYTDEVEQPCKDGSTVWTETTRRFIRNSESGHLEVYGVSRDITERKRAENEIRRLNEGLEQRVRERTAELRAANSELDAFAYAVSHDLRAPLRAMSGFSQALLEDFGSSLQGEAREYLDHIVLASRRMGGLIDGLLQLSRSTRGDLRRDRVDVSALATGILGEFSGADPGRNVSWSVEPGLTAWGDPRMLEAALTNLLGNAWKYTAKRAEARIEVGVQGADGATRDPIYFVRDNGVGFDMKYEGKLFKPFQRLHREDEFSGIGIGLSTAQRILHRHGGRVWAQGEVGKGATFYFTVGEGSGH